MTALCDHLGCDNPKPSGPGRRYCDPCKAAAAARPRPACSIDGCTRPTVARGWCQAHYEHNRTWGRPEPHDLRDRFEEKVSRPTADACWLWLGTGTKSGYGQLSVDGQHHYAHRVSYELHVGPIPDGLQIDHLCRTRRCVNPRHLEPVTPLVNTRRAMAHRRATAGASA